MRQRPIDHVREQQAFSMRLRQLLAQRGHDLVPAELTRSFARATAQTWSNWLNGVQLPRRATMNGLAEWLGTSEDYLLNGVAVLHFKQAPAANDEEHKLLEHFRQMDDCGRRVTLAMAAAAARLKGGGA